MVSSQELFKIAIRAAELRGTSEGAQLAQVFRDSYRLSENYNYDFQTNGELNLLKKIRPFGIKTIFDIGANFGEWAKFALSVFNDAQVHCCEPIPETFAKLTTTLSTEPRVKLHNVAVSDKNGEMEFRHYRDNPGQTSAFYFPNSFEHQTLNCSSRKLDDIAAEQGITQIDLLKIDVEGAEHLVLAGAKNLFSSKSIRIVQFEYGLININTRFLLQDFYDFFKDAGFKVGKIYPNTVDFSEYSLEMENFIGPNFVAVTEAEPEVIRALT